MTAHASIVSHRNLNAVPPAAAPTIDFFGVSQLLGINRHGDHYRRKHIKALIDGANFPPPLPYSVAGALKSDISPTKSRWVRAAVDAWINGTIPPGLAGAVDDQAAREAAARLDAAAESFAA